MCYQIEVIGNKKNIMCRFMWEVRILPKSTLKFLPTGLMIPREMKSELVNSNANLRSFLIFWLPGDTGYLHSWLSGLSCAQMNAVCLSPRSFVLCSLNSFKISFRPK